MSAPDNAPRQLKIPLAQGAFTYVAEFWGWRWPPSDSKMIDFAIWTTTTLSAVAASTAVRVYATNSRTSPSCPASRKTRVRRNTLLPVTCANPSWKKPDCVILGQDMGDGINLHGG